MSGVVAVMRQALNLGFRCANYAVRAFGCQTENGLGWGRTPKRRQRRQQLLPRHSGQGMRIDKCIEIHRIEISVFRISESGDVAWLDRPIDPFNKPAAGILSGHSLPLRKNVLE